MYVSFSSLITTVLTFDTYSISWKKKKAKKGVVYENRRRHLGHHQPDGRVSSVRPTRRRRRRKKFTWMHKFQPFAESEPLLIVQRVQHGAGVRLLENGCALIVLRIEMDSGNPVPSTSVLPCAQNHSSCVSWCQTCIIFVRSCFCRAFFFFFFFFFFLTITMVSCRVLSLQFVLCGIIRDYHERLTSSVDYF